MPEERMADYLDGLDAAAEWFSIDALLDAYAPGFDEWNAIRIATGQPVGEWGDYLADIGGDE